MNGIGKLEGKQGARAGPVHVPDDLVEVQVGQQESIDASRRLEIGSEHCSPTLEVSQTPLSGKPNGFIADDRL